MSANKIAEIPVLPFPPIEVRRKIAEHDLQACFESWNAICQKMLELPPELFQVAMSKTNDLSLTSFLVSLIKESARSRNDDSWIRARQAQELTRLAYLLTHRALMQMEQPPVKLLDWTFLGCFCKTFSRSRSLPSLIEGAWTSHSATVSPGLQKYKNILLKSLDSGDVSSQDDMLSQCLLPLLHACPSAGATLVLGYDLLDAISTAYSSMTTKTKSNLLLLMYVMLLAPLQLQRPNRSLVYDHLYSLDAATKSQRSAIGSHSSALVDLVSETPFIARLRKLISGTPDEGRGNKLASSLEQHRQAQSSRPKRVHRREIDKGKQKVSDTFGHGEAFGDVHVHRISLISQVQELFPDLGDGFVVKLLDNYNDDVEQVTAALLEDNIPPHLQDADHSERLHAHTSAPEIDVTPGLMPRTTPPASPLPVRRNIHDNDEFDRLAVSSSRIRLGHKEPEADAFTQDSTSRSHAKAAIMSALAAFDADDDERDDTYDIEDVGGTVDTAAGPAGDKDATINDMRDKNEEALFTAWKMSPNAFARDSATRRSKERLALKSETGMTDEAVEGWGVMLQRDPSRLRRLEAKYATFSGRQNNQLERTSWRENNDSGLDSEDAGEASSGPESSRGGRGRGGFRGRGKGGRGVSSVAGSSDDKGTQIARQRKDTSKGSRANHNRRDQRARKMARGGMAG